MSWLGFGGKKAKDEAPPVERRLRVSIGPDPDHLLPSFVNNPARPTYVNSDQFEGRIMVRVKDFVGVCPTEIGVEIGKDEAGCQKTTPYFEKPGRNRRFSITIQGRFKADWDAGEIFFGGVFDRKISPPFGTSLMLKAANYIDPSLQSDLEVNVPWVLSNLGTSMNAIIVTPPPAAPPGASSADGEPDHDDSAAKEAAAARPPHPGPPLQRTLPTYPTASSRIMTPAETYEPHPTLGKWIVPPKDSDIDLVEDTRLLFADSSYEEPPCSTSDSKARRKWMKDSENRHSVIFKKDRVVDMEIYAPFVDLNTHNLNLGISVDMSKYINGQPLTLYLLGHRHPPNLARGNTMQFMASIGRRKSLGHSRTTSGGGSSDKKDLPPKRNDGKAKKWWDTVKVFAVIEFALVDEESKHLDTVYRTVSSSSLHKS
ncbi:hypothetical protein DFJ74DRAFT_685576 [Hyaloraphidium curvatum]|nr:hypothetical protein DFJ74DRAFT_685576 [Hyaloraphidium curvatum]